MNMNNYKNAVDKLEFSEDLLEKVRAAAGSKPRFRAVRLAVLAALMALVMATSVFAAVSFLRERPAGVVELGTVTQPMTDAEILKLKQLETMEGVCVHYMELKPNQQYALRHGMLWSNEPGYLRVGQDYQLETVELKRVNATLEKNDKVYRLTLDYLDTDAGVITNHRSLYQKNAEGEILLCATAGRNGGWPIYLNVGTGEIRDALPAWSDADFNGQVSYAYAFMDGVLLTSYPEEEGGGTQMYWIAPGASNAEKIEIPPRCLEYVEYDTVYYQDAYGRLYQMDEKFQFQKLHEYQTEDDMMDGVLVVSIQGKLGIVDAFTGDTYIFEQISVQKWETGDFNALRYGSNGTIALVETEWRHDPERRVLSCLGVLDRDGDVLKMLSIENDCDGYQHGWLDENRFAVVYRDEVRQFLCLYEFE